MTNRVFRDLYENTIARLERQFDAARLVLAALALGCSGLPVDLTRIKHSVAPAPDVDERGLHAWQNVLHAAEVDVADEARLRRLSDIVLDQHAVFKHTDLDAATAGAHHHDPVDALTASEELRLSDYRAATPGIATVTTALLLGLKPGRSLDALGFGDRLRRLARLAHLDDDVRLVVALAGLLAGTPTRATAHAGR